MDTRSGNAGLRQDHKELDQVWHELAEIRRELFRGPGQLQGRIAQVHPALRSSARNLLDYLTLRRRDLRPLQSKLALLGLSSLGRAEPHVLATLNAVLDILGRLTGRELAPASHPEGVIDFETGQRLLADHTQALLGEGTPGRTVRIMVTMPSEAATDYTLVEGLLRQGMDCMRINCAHDDPSTWARMIEHLRRAERALGRSCRVVMDLGGPKLRTGPIEPGVPVVRVQPRRNRYGRVVAPARVWFTSADAARAAPSPADVSVPVAAAWLEGLNIGDRVSFRDARGSKRHLQIVDVTADGSWAESQQTAYLVPGTVLKHKSDDFESREGGRETAVGSLPPPEEAISLQAGDLLYVTRNLTPGRTATRDSAGVLLTPAQIGCTIPGVFDDVRSGESIWFDDGKIGGIVEQIEDDRVLVRITQSRLNGQKLRSDKGINLPESALRLGALTVKDLKDLAFVAEYADVVELSFANTARDVELLQQHLSQLGGRQPAIVLKIETRRGFENLPEILLTAMRGPNCGVMIARGDLAVECGFERLAEVQEEILWICEAAHVPVIWATQVLESLAKEGMPSRAEITDAAMAHRAECVMLNKGPHVLSAVRVLDDILRRMQAHQSKKRSMLRELHLAHAFPVTPGNNLSAQPDSGPRPVAAPLVQAET